MGKMRTIIYVILGILIYLAISLTWDTDSRNLGDGFAYDAEYEHILGNVDIPPTIISYDKDENFIIAKQHPKKHHDAIYDKMSYVYPLGRDTTYYWLILKKEQKVFGPLDASQFAKLRKQYNVPEKLKVDK